MRTGVEQWLLDIWYQRPRPPWYLRMLVPAYRAGFAFDHKNSRNKVASTTAGAAVIVVGNITVGGSGKTPLVLALSQLAHDMQLRVGIATTGYGRQSDQTLTVQADSDPSICGDEPVLLSTRTHAAVVVAKRRADAIAELNKMGVDLIISDDGLQTAGLRRDLEICVVDGARGLGNGHLLPAGPLRESKQRLQEVDCIVSNGAWNGVTLPVEPYVMRLAGTTLHSLDGAQVLPVSAFIQQQQGRTVHAVAAIGHPERFFKSLRELETDSAESAAGKIAWQEHKFADHHAYTFSDFDDINGADLIVMTEKDAVKCRKMALKNAWYLPVEAQLSEAFLDWFRQQLLQLKVD